MGCRDRSRVAGPQDRSRVAGPRTDLEVPPPPLFSGVTHLKQSLLTTGMQACSQISLVKKTLPTQIFLLTHMC